MSDQTLKHRPRDVTDRSVQLTATVAGDVVTVTGDGTAHLGKNSGSHKFKFSLSCPPGLTVTFASLDTQDNCSTCPPAPGENSQQIDRVRMNGATAEFTNKNDNQNGPMDVSYQWNFSCTDPSKRVLPFDPVIRNGGSGGPISRRLLAVGGAIVAVVLIAVSLGLFGKSG